MVILYQIPGAWGVSSVSPFCIKLETFLRMAELPFESRFGDPRKAPRQKVPWIEDADGVVVADSQIAIDHLVEKHALRLDAHLTRDQRMTGHALRRMLEEATYFGLVWLRWGEEAGWAAYRPVMVGIAPPVIGGALMGIIRRMMKKQMFAQGTGRHTPADIQRSVVRDFEAVSHVLGDKPYLFGDAPTTFDATAFAFLSSLLGFPVESEARARVAALDNLVAYRERIATTFFKE